MNQFLNPKIFKDYDIRGTYPDQINEKTYHLLGRAIASFFRVDEIAVGFDTRLSSPSLFRALTDGILEQGTDVVNLGLISTEIHYFASGRYQFPVNIIISASHNPANYNGLKIVTKGVVPLHGSFGLPEIKELALTGVFPASQKSGKMRQISLLSAWIDHALSFVNIPSLSKLTLVVDAGNGMGGLSWKELIGKLPVKIVPLYFEPDGRFPHHLPDPIKKENLIDLQEAIAANYADLGFAIDGDADRLFVVDEKGRAVSGTITTAILAQALLEKNGPAVILYNAVCGRIVPETVKKLDGQSIRVRVGHSFIKETMKKNQALFAGEHSGHYYFRDNFYAESSLITGLILLEYLSKKKQPFSQIVDSFNLYPESGEINFRVQDAVKTLSTFPQKFTDALSKDQLDGLSVWYKSWWFNLRASKTEPLLRLNVEANDEGTLKEKTDFVEKLLISAGGEKIS